jgi:hypothetical protein
VGAQTATDLTCSQCVQSSDIANDSVGSAKIKEGTIASNDIAPSGVKTANINNGAVTFNKLSPGIKEQMNAAISEITFEFQYNEDEGVASVACPVNTFAVSASCGCSNKDGANNFGVLFFCATAGDGVVAGCFDEALTFDELLPPPVAQAQATCAGATLSGGLTSTAFPTGLSANDQSSVNEAQWRNEQKQTREAVVADQQKLITELKNRIRK